MDTDADDALGDHAPALHEARLRFALGAVEAAGARSLLDLGCGSGALLKPALALPRLERIVGVERSSQAVAVARRELAAYLEGPEPRLTLIAGSFLEGLPEPGLHCDAVTLVETIEHLPPDRLDALAGCVFEAAAPALVVVTTPNRDYNPLYGLATHEHRDPDHRFEWGRGRFRAWAARLAGRTGYRVTHGAIGESDPTRGAPTQAAVFRRESG